MSDNILNLIMPNRPEELDEDTDYLGTIPKGQMIIDFIEKISNKNESPIQIIALYGDWGSGKTSLMRWIESHLPKDNFYPIFFEAWQHENDDNLPLSLVDTIISEKPNNNDELKRSLFRLLRCTAKSVTLNLKLLEVLGVKLNLKEGIDEYQKIQEEKSFQERLAEFKKKYEELEDDILGIQNTEKLIVFVDDLDRCEPENVLTLLSAIKLFFTYGKRSIFICGIDKEAINSAVAHKYNNVIKANEYLEKIFDLSFTMPKNSIDKMVKYYFNYLEPQYIEEITNFLIQLNFINPRHLKKVLNKYLLIKYFQDSNIDKNTLIPNLDISFFRILVLFIVIIHEFEYDNFIFIKNYKSKISYYASINKDTSSSSPAIERIEGYLLCYKREIICSMKSVYRLGQALNDNDRKTFSERYLCDFITLFAPKMNSYNILRHLSEAAYCKQFQDGSITGNFCSYLYENKNTVIGFNDGDYKLWNLFKMAELYL